VFEPRNRGIHRFELVEEKEAVHGYELARLTVKNCVHQVQPSDAPVLYGSIVTYSGDAVFERMALKKIADAEAFLFAGIGEPGEHAVLLDRTSPNGRISVLESLADGKLESRYSDIRNHFSSEQMRVVLSALERTKPQVLPEFANDNFNHVLDALLPSGRVRRGGLVEAGRSSS
jgi:hypothetical protein